MRFLQAYYWNHSLARDMETPYPLPAQPGSEDMVLWMAWLKARYEEKPLLNRGKRVFDVTFSLLALAAVAPLFLIIALAIRLTSRGPAFYCQTRFGQYFRPFTLLKFRTMYEDAPPTLGLQNEMTGPLFKIRRDPRITPVGRFLRRWSLDELPQLVNVLLGHMSLVGPRPLPAQCTARIPGTLHLRFAVRPGLTGLWQATIRNSLDGLEKLRKDVEYVHHRSFRFDLWLLWRTIPGVLRGEGAW